MQRNGLRLKTFSQNGCKIAGAEKVFYRFFHLFTFRFSESWGNSNGKNLSQIWTFAHKWCKIAAHFLKYFFVAENLPYLQDNFCIRATIRIGREMLCLPGFFGPRIDFFQILLGAVHNLAMCWKVFQHLLLGVVWGNNIIDQIHNFEESQFVEKLAAVFLLNTIGIDVDPKAPNPGMFPDLEVFPCNFTFVDLDLQ